MPFALNVPYPVFCTDGLMTVSWPKLVVRIRIKIYYFVWVKPQTTHILLSFSTGVGLGLPSINTVFFCQCHSTNPPNSICHRRHIALGIDSVAKIIRTFSKNKFTSSPPPVQFDSEFIQRFLYSDLDRLPLTTGWLDSATLFILFQSTGPNLYKREK
jgi:hypothetical protein